MISQTSRDRQDPHDTLLEQESSSLFNPTNFGRILWFVIMRQSLCLALMAQDNAGVTRIGRVDGSE